MGKLKYILVSAFFCALVGGSYLAAERQFRASLVEDAQDRSQLYVASVMAAKERLAHLPETIAFHPQAEALFLDETTNQVRGKERQDAIEKFNPTLEAIARFSQADALYVMDAEGTTLASSNHDKPGSFVGKNYGFRPYFQNAINGGKGEYFAVGATTGRPGYFVSAPIRLNGEVRGVSVVKTEFERLLNDWENSGELVAVVDENDIVILSSNASLLYHSVSALTPQIRKDLADSRQYGQLDIPELQFQSSNGTFTNEIDLAGTGYVVTPQNIPASNWTLYFLSDFSAVRTGAAGVAGLVALAAGLLILAGLYALSRQRQREFEFQAREAEVIRKINEELRTEIGVREDTEAQLREMQSELVSTARLAALGKMSAAIVHEVNQPVSAINNFAASGMLMLKRKDDEGVGNVLSQIRKMTDRLGSITSDLLIFSRKPVTGKIHVDLNSVARDVIKQLTAANFFEGVSINCEFSPDCPQVEGKLARFEQLFSNLLKNAAQAAAENKRPEVTIRTRREDGKAVVEIADNGVGFPPEVEDQMFEPFFSTKPVGQGIGMGLAICFAIVEETGGRITARSGKEGEETLMRVVLPAAQTSRSTNTKAVEHA